SQVDMSFSTDGGKTFLAMRAPAAVQVHIVANIGSSGQDGVSIDLGMYDTEMLQLDVSGGDLPAGVMLRKSPTLASLGGTQIEKQPAGSYRIHSFFDT